MSFYRIYRPQVIEEIDNVAVKKQLLSLLEKDRKDLPHAFFFYGPKGAGKTTAARVIAKLFNCTKLSKKTGPCGACEQCISIAKGTNMDVIEMDAASNRGIDEIRELRQHIGLSPASASHKIFIIDEVHMLTPEAFNALLKTLEEPPAHAVFILATTDPQKVPATVTSRCMEFNFHKAAQDELLHALARIVTKEKIKIDDSALALITTYADGAFRDAVKLLEQISFSKEKITEQIVRDTLTMSTSAAKQAFLSWVLTRNAKTALEYLEELVSDGIDIKTFLTECLAILHDRLISGTKGEKVEWPVKDISELIRLFTAAFSDIKISPIPQLPLELAILDFCQSCSSGPSNPSPAHVVPSASPAESRSDREKEGLSSLSSEDNDLLTLEKLTSHWPDVITALKLYNHSVAGVLHSSRPKFVANDTVTIEAFYKFHQERLSDTRVRDMLSQVLKKLFGANVKVEVVLGKK